MSLWPRAGVGNLWHACQRWHVSCFLMARGCLLGLRMPLKILPTRQAEGSVLPGWSVRPSAASRRSLLCLPPPSPGALPPHVQHSEGQGRAGQGRAVHSSRLAGSLMVRGPGSGWGQSRDREQGGWDPRRVVRGGGLWRGQVGGRGSYESRVLGVLSGGGERLDRHGSPGGSVWVVWGCG